VTDYRVFPSSNGGSLAADTTAYTLGIEVYATQDMQLTGYWWWCAAGASTAPVQHGLFTVVSALTGTLVSGSTVTSGTLTQGQWNFTALSPAIDLTPNQRYRAGAAGGGSVNWYGAIGSGFPADIVNGPLVAPSTANAVGNIQGCFNTAVGLTYPKDTSGANYGMDVQVSDPPSNITATAGLASVTATAPQPAPDVGAAPGAAAVTVTAYQISAKYPQTTTRSRAAGYEPGTTASGYEPPTAASGEHA
jgi:hypothetical protein